MCRLAAVERTERRDAVQGATAVAQEQGAGFGEGCLEKPPAAERTVTTDGVVPAYKDPFHLNNGQESALWFPGIRTGTTWNVTITCEHGGLNNSQVIY